MPTLALTPGCPAGIGPEIFPKALTEAKLDPSTNFVWCASAGLLEKHAKASGIDSERNEKVVTLKSHGREIKITCQVEDTDDRALFVNPGEVTEDALRSQREALEIAIKLAQAKKIQGMVTGPIRKAALADVGGMRFDGQTEYLHHFLAADDNPPLMCFAGADFLLGLATIHVPLKDVADQITPALLDAKIRRLHEAVRQLQKNPPTPFHKGGENASAPRIVVFGLNPHAGENGLIGDEEIRVIGPAIEKLKAEGFNLEGPVAADGFFGHLSMLQSSEVPHAVLAMYHDQGLSPYKLLCKGVGVNMTLGLTIARTSPAHGTADALAGKYQASAASVTRAIEFAQKMSIFAA